MASKLEKNLQTYTNNNFLFPSVDTPVEEKKNPEYGLKVARAMFAEYRQNKSAFTTNQALEYYWMRLYGQGMQDEDIYKPWVIGRDNAGSIQQGTSEFDGEYARSKDYKRKGWGNIKYLIVSPMPNIRQKIHGMFDQFEVDIRADNIDSNSGDEATDAKWLAWAKMEFGKEIDKMKIIADIPLDSNEYIPESKEELEMHEANGGFKTNFAKSMEKLIKHTEKLSGWKEVRKKVIDDFIDLNVGISKVEWDANQKKYIWRYVDPETFVAQFSRYDDFRNSEYMGEYKEYKLSSLIQEFDLSDEQANAIMQEYNGFRDNPSENEWNNHMYNRTSNQDRAVYYKSYTVDVLEFEKIEVDIIDKKIKGKNKEGKSRYYEYKEGEAVGNNREVKEVKVRRVYQGKWIIGTDHILWRLKPNQIRPTTNSVGLSYHPYKLRGKSLTKTCEPMLDNIQHLWLKYQNALTQVFQESWAVDMRMMANVTDGNKAFGFDEIITMWRDKSVLPFMGTPAGQPFYRGGATVPVHKLPGGMGERLNESMQGLDYNIRLIEYTTGINPVTLGATPKGDLPVATMEQMLSSTHTSLKLIIEACYVIKKYLSRDTISCLQAIFKSDKTVREVYAKVVGDVDVEALKITKNLNLEDGITLEPRPTDREKQDLIQAAMDSYKTYQAGGAGISLGDLTYIEERIRAGENTKELRMYLDYKDRKAKEKAHQEKMQLAQVTEQGAMERQQMQMQADAQKLQAETQSQMAIDTNKGQQDRSTQIIKANTQYLESLKETDNVEQ